MLSLASPFIINPCLDWSPFHPFSPQICLLALHVHSALCSLVCYSMARQSRERLQKVPLIWCGWCSYCVVNLQSRLYHGRNLRYPMLSNLGFCSAFHAMIHFSGRGYIVYAVLGFFPVINKPQRYAYVPYPESWFTCTWVQINITFREPKLSSPL